MPLALKALPVLAAVYLLSPLDFIPDILPGMGQVDDLLVTTLLLTAFTVLSPWRVVLEHATGVPAPEQPSPDRGGPVIDGKFRYEDDEGSR